MFILKVLFQYIDKKLNMKRPYLFLLFKQKFVIVNMVQLLALFYVIKIFIYIK